MTVTRFLSRRPLPDEFADLSEIALDLRWTGSQTLSRLWSRMDAKAWEISRNPYTILSNAHSDVFEQLKADSEFVEELTGWIKHRAEYLESPGWFKQTHTDTPLKGVAYFSMEFGLSEALPIYSGGLGMLAGDHMKAASDLDAPVVGIGLLYQQGYFHQLIAEDGSQLEAFPYNDPSSLPISPVHGPDGSWPRVRLKLPGRTLYVRPWLAKVGRVDLYLLDTNDPLNHPWDRGITANLYAAGQDKRLLQELVLGVAGWRMLDKLGIDANVCHLNEGHAAFAVVERAADFARDHGVDFEAALEATRAGTVFTTHTPVEAAFDKFPVELLRKYLAPITEADKVPLDKVIGLGRRDPEDETEPFNMAYLAMRGSYSVNGVSRLHGAVSRKLFSNLFPGRPIDEVPVGHVTNGVHVPSWDSDQANQVWRQAMGSHGWQDDMDKAAEGLSGMSDSDLWDFRARARHDLVEYVRRRLRRQLRQRGATEKQLEHARHVLDPNVLTLGFARRFTEYKRPNMLLQDIERFKRLLKNPERPVQMIIAGKAHPRDTQGKGMVRRMADFAMHSDVRDRVVFLEDYDMALAQNLAGGVDVWLNTPRRPAEACGTSGMKMLVNGGLNLSELDGWWDEAYAEDVGWALGDGQNHTEPGWDERESVMLYELLENEVARHFYERNEEGVPGRWVSMIRNSMARLTPQFSAGRMVKQYVEDAYLPCARAFVEREKDNGALAVELCRWRDELERDWQSARFAKIEVHESDETNDWDVQVYFGDLDPDAASVELYADATEGFESEVIVMERDGHVVGTTQGYHFKSRVPKDRPTDHYTPRIVPRHNQARVPLEAQQILWLK